MTHYDIVKKLIGHVMPVGQSNEDANRFNNLESLTSLAAQIIWDIAQVAEMKDRQEYSMRIAGEAADSFIHEYLAAQPKWMPIEQAPKDGTEVDVIVRTGRITNCAYIGGKWCTYNNRYNDGSPAWFALFGKPTHFMLIPELP